MDAGDKFFITVVFGLGFIIIVVCIYTLYDMWEYQAKITCEKSPNKRHEEGRFLYGRIEADYSNCKYCKKQIKRVAYHTPWELGEPDTPANRRRKKEEKKRRRSEWLHR